jgi:hypothetical protein
MCGGPPIEKHKQISRRGRANFLEEARTLARFEHPSIVRVARVFEANATAYMVMRFEQGRSFATWLTSLGRSPTQQELDAIVAPLLDALETLHAQDFLHRDIAPDNIIVRADGTPVLLDFGAARHAVAEATCALTGVIKAGYSPHEQYTSNSRLQGPWSDLYALGGTLYRAVTGQAPEEATLRVGDDHMPSAVKAANGDYRPRFLAAIDACLEVMPSERPQSVAQLRAMLLGQSFYQKAIQWRISPPALGPAAWRWLASAATALALLAGGYGGLQYMRSPAIATEAHQRADAAAAGSADEQASTEAQAQAEAGRKQDERLAAEARLPKTAHARRWKPRRWPGRRGQERRAGAGQGRFDGEWEVVGVGGERCRAKT